MIKMIDAENRVNLLSPGEAIFALLEGKPPQVVFLARERSALIKSFGETNVEVCSDLFPVGRVTVTAVIFRAGQYVRHEYLTWWDYYRPGCDEIFRAMAGQEFLSFHFYGDNDRRDRLFVTANTLGDFFAKAIDTIGGLPPWTGDDFQSACLRICGRLPTPKAMWDAAQQTEDKQ